ncbi:hypothetical protein CPC08DRAFT_719897 [Agrocybe pediades]|nr:hypothetical protein CPC08DRAFT_719897 [Agrocybe pediades]
MELAKKCGVSGRTFNEVTIADPNTEVVDDEPEGYLDAFQATFWRPYIASSITKLSFHHAIEVPVEIILECVHLVDLSSYFATLLPPSNSKGEGASVGRNTGKKIALKRLSLGTHSTKTFYEILFGSEGEEGALIDTTKLETYGCAWHSFTDSELDDQDAAERTMRIAASSLRKLEFERVGRIPCPGVINLAALPNVQALDFDYDWQLCWTTAFENMCDIMSTAQRGHKLSRTDIHRIIHTDELIDRDCSVRSCREKWLALDKALVRLASAKSNEVEELVLSYEIIVCTKTRLDDAKFRNEMKIRSIVKTMEDEFLDHAMPLSKQSPSIRVQVITSIEQYDAYAPRHRDVMHIE